VKKRKLYNDGQWTEARFNSFVTSILRSGSRRWGPKYTTLHSAKVGKQLNKLTGRIAEHYQCMACKQLFPASQIQVDHIKPIGYNKSWDEFINNLFCEADNLQVLCKPCHKIKTNKEKAKQKKK